MICVIELELLARKLSVNLERSLFSTIFEISSSIIFLDVALTVSLSALTNNYKYKNHSSLLL